jgi:hypothetical protein
MKQARKIGLIDVALGLEKRSVASFLQDIKVEQEGSSDKQLGKVQLPFLAQSAR